MTDSRTERQTDRRPDDGKDARSILLSYSGPTKATMSRNCATALAA